MATNRRHEAQLNNLGSAFYDLGKLSYGGVIAGIFLPMISSGNYTRETTSALIYGLALTVIFFFVGYKLKTK